MSDTIQIEIDGRTLEVEKGSMLLENIRRLGVRIPTLCHHPSLEPNGECRLCLVEITHPDWRGWSNLVTSCLYPASPGLQVFTRSPRVIEARRTLLELYLSQYPEAELIRDLAREEGVDSTPFPESDRTDTCVLCGLCTRTCQELSVGAIAPLSRGTEKKVGPRPDMVAEDCTACGACAFICPTGAIELEQTPGKIRIWNREFDIPLYKVEQDRCRGCGICEEVCPWDIPRVILLKSGEVSAYITPTYCIGCGICAGACPTAAIRQDAIPDRRLEGAIIEADALRGKVVVFACSRSPLPAGIGPVINVPCIGRVTIEHMLACLAGGADGVLLMCRDQPTCPAGPGGQLGWERSGVADQICASIGLGHGRVVCLKPNSGLDGPAAALEKFRTELPPSPLKNPLTGLSDTSTGLDRALYLTTRLREHPELTPSLPDNLKQILEPINKESDTALYLGDLPDLDLLLSLTMKEWRLEQIFRDAVEILKRRDMYVRPVFTVREINESAASRVVTLCPSAISGLERAIETITIGSLTGLKPNRSETTDCRFRFRINQFERRALLEKLQIPGRSMASLCPHELAQYRLLTRQGAWLGPVAGQPRLAFSDVAKLTQGDT